MAFVATNLGVLPGGNSSFGRGVSANGTVAVGSAIDAAGHPQSVYWDGANLIHQLPALGSGINDAFASCCSSTGSTIVGVSTDNTGHLHAVTWTGGPSWVVHDLGFLPGGSVATARGCSSDAAVVVGESSVLPGVVQVVWPTVWTSGTPSQLPTPVGAATGLATACSANGTLIYGAYVDAGGTSHPVVWSGGPSWGMIELATLSGGLAAGFANQPNACSSNGAVAVGIASNSGGATLAVTWNPGIAALPGPFGGVGSIALGCDASGSTVVGAASATGPDGSAARWVGGTGAYLPTFSGGVTGQALAASGDGSVIVGYATVGPDQRAVKWSNAGAPLVWFRMNTGAWFPDGDPALQTGGISLAVLAGQALFASVQGTGDAGITLNAGASPFVGAVPTGYISGLPHSGGGFTTLDPAKRFGSASLSGGNLIAGFPTSPGMAQSVDGYTSGAYYFELNNPTGDIFSADWGGGVGVNFNGGGDFNQWFNNGRLSAGNANGGALLTGQSLIHALSSLGALGVSVLSDVFNFSGGGAALGIALYISANPPPPTPVVPGRGFLVCGNDWTISLPTTVIYGLDHLVGKTVVGLADGVPIGPLVVDANGWVTLPFPASFVTLGLSFTVQLQTPYLDIGNPTVQGRRKDITAATVRVDASAAPMVGSNQPDGGSFTPTQVGPAWSNLQPAVTQDPQQYPGTYTNPAGQTVTLLFSGDFRATLQPGWDERGQIAVQQTLPVPLAVTALMPEALQGDLPEQGISPPQQGQGEQPGPGLWMLSSRGRR